MPEKKTPPSTQPILRRLFYYIRPHLNILMIAVACTLLHSILVPLRPYVIKTIIDDEIGTGNQQGILIMGMVLFAILFLQAILQFISTYLTQLIGQKTIQALRQDVFKFLQTLQLRYFDKNPIGRLMTRTTSDVESLNEILSSGIISLLGNLVQIIFIVIVMFWIEWRLTLLVLSVLPIMFFGSIIFKKKIRVTYENVRKEVAQLNTFLQEHITGHSTIQMFGREKKEFTEHDQINARHRDANIKSVFYYSIFYPFIEMISACALALIIWFSVPSVYSESITIGVVVSFIQYISLFFFPIQEFSDKYNVLQSATTSAERIFQLLDEKEITTPLLHKNELKNLQGNISFKNVNYAYVKDHQILHNISFDIQSGEKIAIVGATGSGKSTIINLLCKFYPINEGTITIDGIDIATLEEYDIRKNVGVILQDVFLFSGTILENLQFGNKNFTLDQIREMAKIIDIDDFITSLPNGYNYKIAEQGAGLSSGQRQLISFLRMMLYNPKILILDEATSSIDAEYETKIEKATQILMQGRTTIIIAHRLSTIQKCNRIIVMNKGKIREIGTHTELLSQDGLYSKLYYLQFSQLISKDTQ